MDTPFAVFAVIPVADALIGAVTRPTGGIGLPEGTTTLPEGARIDWKLVTVDIT